MKQEHNYDQRNDDRFLDEAPFQSAYRCADQSRAVITGHDLDSRRQRSFDLSQLFLYAINHVESVKAVAHHYNPAHGLTLTVPLGDALTDVRSKRHGAQVLDQYGR